MVPWSSNPKQLQGVSAAYPCAAGPTSLGSGQILRWLSQVPRGWEVRQRYEGAAGYSLVLPLQRVAQASLLLVTTESSLPGDTSLCFGRRKGTHLQSRVHRIPLAHGSECFESVRWNNHRCTGFEGYCCGCTAAESGGRAGYFLPTSSVYQHDYDCPICDARYSPAGKLLPTFIDCRESRVFTDTLTKSKKCPDQVKVALDLAADFITTMGVDFAGINFVTPYSANIEVMRRMRRKAEYACLSKIPDPLTVDAYQGRENDIIILVLGNKHPKPGPGFMTNENRLNVAMTRARAGLVVVGDIYACGGKISPSNQDTANAEAEEEGLVTVTGKGKARQPVFFVEDAHGSVRTVKAVTLRKVHLKFVEFNRVATIKIRDPANKDQPAPAATDDQPGDADDGKKKKGKKKKGKKDTEEKEENEEEKEEVEVEKQQTKVGNWAEAVEEDEEEKKEAKDKGKGKGKEKWKGKGKGKEVGSSAPRPLN